MPFDLGSLHLSSGEGKRLEVPVPVEAFQFGGQRYVPEASGDALVLLDVARTSGQGYSMRIRFEMAVEGPCMRCLEGARQPAEVDSREIDQPGGIDDLDSPYVQDDDLDIEGWVRDALALALPAQILCAEDCRGLCAVCGENLNEVGADHSHPKEPDARWAQLSDLRFDA
ncbi:MAG: DUF177 domain-containing protein [Thermoleophilaceae bacterium]|nr:DUF177 domain-containing protein [Thermoleophilaceae bacterium]